MGPVRRSLTLLACSAALAAVLTDGAAAAAPDADAVSAGADAAARPAVTLLFSRSELGHAVDCRADLSPEVVRLATTVAPELQRRGLRATGTLETSTVRETAPSCLHYRRTLAMSWADAAHYRDRYGWSFVSHGRTRRDLTTLGDTALVAEVRGSLQDLERRGHRRASGMYAYQNNRYDSRTQEVVRRHFDFGRTYRYQPAPDTKASVGAARYQRTTPAGGGRCRAATRACTDNAFTAAAYNHPGALVAAVRALRPGQWLTVQSYVFVQGSRPGQWDCTSPDPRLHWTADAERYCYVDYLRILDAIAARPDVVVTDPYTVARAWYGPRGGAGAGTGP